VSQNKSKFKEIKFRVEKIYLHHWPLNTPKWEEFTINEIDEKLNRNKEKKQITVTSEFIIINNYKLEGIKKVGLTIPLFKKQCTLVFECHFGDTYAHVHITIEIEKYLEIFNKLMEWREKYFPDSIESA